MNILSFAKRFFKQNTSGIWYTVYHQNLSLPPELSDDSDPENVAYYIELLRKEKEIQESEKNKNL